MNKIKQPTKEEIKQARINAGLTQSSASKIVHVDIRTWQRWEEGSRTMHPAFFELFALKLKI